MPARLTLARDDVTTQSIPDEDLFLKREAVKQLEKANAVLGVLIRKMERTIELLDDVKYNTKETKNKVSFTSSYVPAIWIVILGILVYLIVT